MNRPNTAPLPDLIRELETGMRADALSHRRGLDRHCRFCGGIVPGELCEDHAAVRRYDEIVAGLRSHHHQASEDLRALKEIAALVDSDDFTTPEIVDHTIEILREVDCWYGGR